MTDATTVYKVVRKTNTGGHESAMAYGVLRRAYSTNEWTRGHRGTPVMAFRTFKEARRFKAGRYRLEVWKAKAVRPRTLSLVSSLAVFSILPFWKRIAGKQWWRLDWVDDSRNAPGGTLACEAIKLEAPASTP